MRLGICGFVLGAVMAWPLMAEEPRNADIEAVINGQMQAFVAQDVARAFDYASPNIKGIFGTAQNFGVMVQRGYPMVWNPADIKMLELREVAGNLWQRVMVTDQVGRSHMLDYQMIETPAGWQINAVQLLPSVDVGV